MSKSRILKTPGVYVEEVSPAPRSIAQVETALPAFIGYTEKAERNGVAISNVPVKISTLLEFEEVFGRGFKAEYGLRRNLRSVVGYEIFNAEGHRFILYQSMRLFFQNGGRDCYIVSIGTYGNTIISPQFDLTPFSNGLKVLETQSEVTLVLSPDATQLNETECYQFQSQLLNHCGTMKNRFAILDIHSGFEDLNGANPNCIDRFRQQVNSNFMKFGAAYYPWLHTNMTSRSDVDFTYLNASGRALLKTICENYAEKKLTESQREQIKPVLEVLLRPKDSTKKSFAKTKISVSSAHKTLSNLITSYKSIMESVLERENLLPPSAAMAGIYAFTDTSRGVWKAPANLVINGITKPAVEIDNTQQDELNVHTSGKSICAIRPFSGKGILVWGARTLDGNNNEYKYISIQRTMISIKESVKNGLRAFVFETNDARIWTIIKSAIENYLNNLWRQGGLAGAKPSDAYFVKVGLGETMTANDINNNMLIVEIGMALSRPAEFIIERITLEMTSS